jgi:glutamine synthetase
LILKTLGEHVFTRLIEIKRQEWEDYRTQLSAWEMEKYLPIL